MPWSRLDCPIPCLTYEVCLRRVILGSWGTQKEISRVRGEADTGEKVGRGEGTEADTGEEIGRMEQLQANEKEQAEREQEQGVGREDGTDADTEEGTGADT